MAISRPSGWCIGALRSSKEASGVCARCVSKTSNEYLLVMSDRSMQGTKWWVVLTFDWTHFYHSTPIIDFLPVLLSNLRQPIQRIVIQPQKRRHDMTGAQTVDIWSMFFWHELQPSHIIDVITRPTHGWWIVVSAFEITDFTFHICWFQMWVHLAFAISVRTGCCTSRVHW